MNLPLDSLFCTWGLLPAPLSFPISRVLRGSHTIYPGVNHPLHLRDITGPRSWVDGVRWGGPIQELETKERVFSHSFFFFKDMLRHI